MKTKPKKRDPDPPIGQASPEWFKVNAAAAECSCIPRDDFKRMVESGKIPSEERECTFIVTGNNGALREVTETVRVVHRSALIQVIDEAARRWPPLQRFG